LTPIAAESTSATASSAGEEFHDSQFAVEDADEFSSAGEADKFFSRPKQKINVHFDRKQAARRAAREQRRETTKFQQSPRERPLSSIKFQEGINQRALKRKQAMQKRNQEQSEQATNQQVHSFVHPSSFKITGNQSNLFQNPMSDSKFRINHQLKNHRRRRTIRRRRTRRRQRRLF
jgi:hypothetical protein